VRTTLRWAPLHMTSLNCILGKIGFEPRLGMPKSCTSRKETFFAAPGTGCQLLSHHTAVTLGQNLAQYLFTCMSQMGSLKSKCLNVGNFGQILDIDGSVIFFEEQIIGIA
jgi:hypothetical protein